MKLWPVQSRIYESEGLASESPSKPCPARHSDWPTKTKSASRFREALLGALLADYQPCSGYSGRGTGDQPAAHHQGLPATGFSVSEGFQQAWLTAALNVVTEQQEFTRSSRALGADSEGRGALVDAEGETAGADGELEHVSTLSGNGAC